MNNSNSNNCYYYSFHDALGFSVEAGEIYVLIFENTYDYCKF